MSSPFAARTSVEVVEEGQVLAPKFDASGLIPVVTTDAKTGELLMHAYMNAAALLKTIETGEAYYTVVAAKTFDPLAVYGDAPNPTQL